MNKFIAILSLCAAMLIAGITNAQAATLLRFAHAAPESDLQQDLALAFKDEVEKESNGDIKIIIFPHGQLGDDNQMIDGVRTGTIDIVMSGVNNYTSLVPEIGVLTLPFIFSDREQAYKVLDGDIGTKLLNQLENFKLEGLGFAENGFREITNNRGPIRESKDLKGLRMRVNNSRELSDTFELLGANPQQLPVAELYTALENGVVDAQDHPLTIVRSFKFYEVQKYLSLTNHAYAPLLVTMNLAKFNKLSSANQDIIKTAAKHAIDKERKLSIEENDEMIADLKDHGMQINSDVDTKAFQEKIQPVWESFKKRHGSDLIDAILETEK